MPRRDRTRRRPPGPCRSGRWCSSWDPWLMFSRATSIPASTSSRIFSGVPTAGPRVHTIFALRTAPNLARVGSIQAITHRTEIVRTPSVTAGSSPPSSQIRCPDDATAASLSATGSRPARVKAPVAGSNHHIASVCRVGRDPPAHEQDPRADGGGHGVASGTGSRATTRVRPVARSTACTEPSSRPRHLAAEDVRRPRACRRRGVPDPVGQVPDRPAAAVARQRQDRGRHARAVVPADHQRSRTALHHAEVGTCRRQVAGHVPARSRSAPARRPARSRSHRRSRPVPGRAGLRRRRGPGRPGTAGARPARWAGRPAAAASVDWSPATRPPASTTFRWPSVTTA